MKKEKRFYFSTAVVLLLSCVFGIYSILDANLFEKHYIFTPDQLHALSKDAIAKYGNDTRAVVDSIVGQLRADAKLSPYLSTGEEWCFNNAGGAMVSLTLFHSERPLVTCWKPAKAVVRGMATEVVQIAFDLRFA